MSMVWANPLSAFYELVLRMLPREHRRDAIGGILQRFPPSRLIMGNHERMLLRLFEGEMTKAHYAWWMYNGGIKTLESYAIHDILAAYEDIRWEILEGHPGHLHLLRHAQSHYVEGKYCFVHAGIRPGISLVDQRVEDMMSIGDVFLESAEQFEKIIVHGHTRTWHLYPEVHDNRIALDTAAFNFGRLTALVVEQGEATRFLLTKPGYPMQIDEYPAEKFAVVLRSPMDTSNAA